MTIIAATPTSFLGLDPWLAFRCIAKAGIVNVEVPALPMPQAIDWGQTTFAPELLGADGGRRLRDRIVELGLVPITVGAYTNIREEAQVEPLLRRIDLADALGASFVIVDAAGPETATTDEWRRIGIRGRYVGEYAADRNVRLAFEIHEGLAHSGAAARRLVEAIDHAAIGINYDTGNAIYYNDGIDPVDDIESVLDRLFHMHVKDTSGGRGDWAFGPLGSGRVDLPTVLSKALATGFEGPFSLEIEGLAGEDLTRAQLVERVGASRAYLVGIVGEAGPNSAPAARRVAAGHG